LVSGHFVYYNNVRLNLSASRSCCLFRRRHRWCL